MRVPIKNVENLERDVRSMGIVNTDRTAREKYLRNKEKVLAERQEMETLKQRVNKLEEIVLQLSNQHMRF